MRSCSPACAGNPGVLRSAVLAAALLAVSAAGVRAASLDDRVYAVARRLMCPVCAGQTVAESDSAVAWEMRDVIRSKLAAGESSDQILRYFVGQFGEGVLAEPPRRGLAWALYAAPAAAVAAGLAIVVLLLRRRTGPAAPASPAPPPAAPEDRERLRRELDALER